MGETRHNRNVIIEIELNRNLTTFCKQTILDLKILVTGPKSKVFYSLDLGLIGWAQLDFGH